MGFYKDSKDENRNHLKSSNTSRMARLLGVVVLSALIGSGTTFALTTNYLQSMNSTSPVASTPSGDTGAAVSTEPTSAKVNTSSDITQIVKNVEPAVMAVVNYQNTSNPYTGQSTMQEYGVGTGVYFYSDGKNAYVVTNNHVVQGAAKVEAVLQSGKHVAATVVGTDPYTDLAVIKIAESNLQGVNPVKFANSDQLQAGQSVVAIGTPMGLDFAESVTSGIVSAPTRVMPVENPDSNQVVDYQNAIQTDAAINPGNSGGPLLNSDGQVIGINSSKIVEQDVQGMGFAIPSNEVVNIANQLMKTGHAEHPALGISELPLAQIPQQFWPDVPVQYGVVVEKVTSKEAKDAGLAAGDVIVGIDGHTVQTDADLRTYLFKDKPGQTVPVEVYRGQKKLTLKVTLTSIASPNTTASGSDGNSGSSGNSGQSGNPFFGGGSQGNGGSSSDPLDPFSGQGGF